MTTGFCARDQDIRWLQTEIDAIKVREAYRLVRNSLLFIKQLLFGLKESDDMQARDATYARISELCQIFKAEDKRVLYEMKIALREGILAFEQYEAEVVKRASGQLMAALQETLKAVGDYYQRLAEHMTSQGITLESLPSELGEEAIPEDLGLPGHGGKI
jgi:sulfite reductase (NADPH) flavoprotein alpha-component